MSAPSRVQPVRRKPLPGIRMSNPPPRENPLYGFSSLRPGKYAILTRPD